MKYFFLSFALLASCTTTRVCKPSPLPPQPVKQDCMEFVRDYLNNNPGFQASSESVVASPDGGFAVPLTNHATKGQRIIFVISPYISRNLVMRTDTSLIYQGKCRYTEMDYEIKIYERVAVAVK